MQDLTEQKKNYYMFMDKITHLIFQFGSALFDSIKDELPPDEFTLSSAIEFRWEVEYYVVHMIDRSLSDLADSSSRYDIIEKLLVSIINAEYDELYDINTDINMTNIENVFRDLFNTRMLEYGNSNNDWYARVTFSFGKYASETLITSDKDSTKTSMLIAAQASELNKIYLPSIDKLLLSYLENN